MPKATSNQKLTTKKVGATTKSNASVINQSKSFHPYLSSPFFFGLYLSFFVTFKGLNIFQDRSRTKSRTHFTSVYKKSRTLQNGKILNILCVTLFQKPSIKGIEESMERNTEQRKPWEWGWRGNRRLKQSRSHPRCHQVKILQNGKDMCKFKVVEIIKLSMIRKQAAWISNHQLSHQFKFSRQQVLRVPLHLLSAN